MNVFFDVLGTLRTMEEVPRPRAREAFLRLKEGHDLYLGSSGGAGYAAGAAELLGVADLVSGCLDKRQEPDVPVDFVVDDDAGARASGTSTKPWICAWSRTRTAAWRSRGAAGRTRFVASVCAGVGGGRIERVRGWVRLLLGYGVDDPEPQRLQREPDAEDLTWCVPLTQMVPPGLSTRRASPSQRTLNAWSFPKEPSEQSQRPLSTDSRRPFFTVTPPLESR